MTTYDRGDLVLVGFVFSDESGRKVRPALIVSSRAYNRARQEAIVAAITSNIRRGLFGDHLIADWKKAGLLFPSMVTAIIRTVKHAMVDRKIGLLTPADLEAVTRELRRSLSL